MTERGFAPQRPSDVAPDGRRALGAHVLIIVQNLPVPLDRRVWLECHALIARGYDVSVICPKGPGDPDRQQIDGVHIYKYRPAPEAHGLIGFVVEFVYSWLCTAWLSTQVWQRRPIDIMQACNPPDTFWLLARLWRGRGVKFVFDQHDLNPELFLSRFGAPKGMREKIEYHGLLWLERMTYRTADRIISTNESYKAIALSRGRRRAEEVTVVRSGPDTQEMRPIYPQAKPAGPRQFSLVYLGIMGPQDGVDIVLDVMHELVHRRGRTDVHATLLGFGDCFEELRQKAIALDLESHTVFTGRADKKMIAEHLSAADVGLCPDLKTPLNDVSTMNKTMEYMAYALPSVSFDLVETRVSGGDAVLYVESGNVNAFADAVELLLDDPDLRLEMGLRARERVSRELDWRPQSEKYLNVYDALSGRVPQAAETDEPERSPQAASNSIENRYVDLADSAELRRFILERSPR
ncbi:glycosyltransferase family 4 protein [Microlunatus panaciterrae]|uniref:Glycosyltransferase involved in cell wall biosynthesis n=1 Tax=Microlunatus panaciterrae TaxID=400768 RepID=A0ABS2RHN2_9ACTN|nr:glycosyltransferase family 4 protein [Microlunatus panaciterrae]MBM7798508.1 glycosyltransferase involved in cell wall biosynthesis [Microlunatus panaciterrae]